ncbi:hypothetical protein FACS1894170_11470 [Planctomycetales bacterium]|nr:hypothetical protein FACS1894170_11470 [Planctomycetales bacterium]
MKQPSIDANILLHEKLEALLQEFDQVGDNAPSGQVLNNLDAFLFDNGRKFLTDCLQIKMQERIKRAEKSAEIEAGLKGNPAVRKNFQEAKGDTEFTTDGAFGYISRLGKPA